MTSNKSALLIIDLQNDFCDPEGSLAVNGGALHLAQLINDLLSYKGFVVRACTLSSPGKDHLFDAHNHDEDKDHVELPNSKEGRSHETYKQELWPAHCEPGTKGYEIIPGIDQSKIDFKVLKNQHPGVVMYSGFADRHGNHKHDQPDGAVSHHLEDEFRAKNVTDVFLVGSTGDYGVAHTAIDSANLGFNTYVVEDLMENLDHSSQEWAKQRKALDRAGVKFVQSNGPAVTALKN